MRFALGMVSSWWMMCFHLGGVSTDITW